MASIGQNQYTLALFLILAVWASQVMARKLHEASSSSERHEQWMQIYGKVYKDAAEKEKRYQIFKDNVEFIESFNAAGNNPFNLSVNQFADLTNEEFKAFLNGNKKLDGLTTSTVTSFRYENVTVVPATMDWRKRGAVTPIKDQRECASCWAFSTAASIESIHQITTGKLVSLSEQELVDCVKGQSEGCKGGYVEDSFKFIIKKGGITSEANYPYKNAHETCNLKNAASHIVAQIKGYEKVPANKEKELLKAVANQPVSVYIEGGGDAFQFYSGGVFTGKCGTDLDHTVTVVGYGTTDDGTKYWLVKNSWGTAWGEKGYIRMKRDIRSKKGLCGIAVHPSYPVV